MIRIEWLPFRRRTTLPLRSKARRASEPTTLMPRSSATFIYGLNSVSGVVNAAHAMRLYLEAVAPDAAAELEPALNAIAAPLRASPADAAATRAQLTRFDRERARWTKRMSLKAWELHRQTAVTLRDLSDARAGDVDHEAWSRQVENSILWVAKHHPKVVVFDTAEALATPDGSGGRGAALRRVLGPRYRALGFIAHYGEVWARLRPFAIPEGRAGELGVTLARAGLPALALPLRPVAPGLEWFDAARPLAVLHSSEPTHETGVQIARSFDALLFVDQVSPVAQR